MPAEEMKPYYKKRTSAPVCFLVKQNYISVKHWQSEIEVVYVQSGWVDISVNGTIAHVEPGHLLFISSGVLHYFDKHESDSVIFVIKMLADNVLAPQFSDDTTQMISELYKRSFMVTMNGTISEIVSQIIESDYQELTACFLTAKLMELTVCLLTNPQLIFNQISAMQSESAKDLSKMLKFIEKNASERITLKTLSEHLGFSECYCSKYIKKKTNMTFLECLNAVRIGRAEELLQRTDANITEIAYQVGFASTQNFDRVFKSMKNVSPTEYRKRLHGKK